MSFKFVERIKIWLAKNVFSLLMGLNSEVWMRFLKQEKFRIHPRYFLRFLLITMASFANQRATKNEKDKWGKFLENVEVSPPVFILGHWRSGTTHLHNLLSLDPQFACPNFIQATNPNTFLSKEEQLKNSKAVNWLSPKTRMIDSMQADLNSPMEDEVALLIMTGLSPVMGNIFPKNRDFYNKYLSFEHASKSDREVWKAALLLFLKKLTLKYRQAIVLKSPPHTCRIKMILEVFPNAQFIHIHRNPYDVFSSYIRSIQIFEQLLKLQNQKQDSLEEFTLKQYREMYNSFFEQKNLVPEGNFCEISYENLISSPLEELKKLYYELGLTSFNETQAIFLSYLDSISGFETTVKPKLDEQQKNKIYKEWTRCFAEWGYSR